MKKRYCINVDQCIGVPLTAPFMWTVFLCLLFLFLLWAEGSKDLGAYFESLTKGPLLWLFLSGPLSLFAACLLSAFFIAFPTSYVELDETGIRVHRAFKGNIFIQYKDLLYVRFRPDRGKLWAGIFLAGAEYIEINTIEIRKEPPCQSIWFSSFKRTYTALATRIQSASFHGLTWKKDDYYIAKPDWIDKNGSPLNQKWGGHYGRYWPKSQ